MRNKSRQIHARQSNQQRKDANEKRQTRNDMIKCLSLSTKTTHDKCQQIVRGENHDNTNEQKQRLTPMKTRKYIKYYPASTVPRRLKTMPYPKSPRRNDSPPGSTPFRKPRRPEPNPKFAPILDTYKPQAKRRWRIRSSHEPSIKSSNHAVSKKHAHPSKQRTTDQRGPS